jgi:inner membrane protein
VLLKQIIIMETPEIKENRSFFRRYAYGIKAIIIGILVLLLLIPAAMIQGIISERRSLQDEATAEVSAKWANAQNVAGPVLVVPYKKVLENVAVAKGQETIAYAYFLPERLIINGTLLPEIRKRGIYEVAVYNSKMNMKGAFAPLDLSGLPVPVSALQFNNAFLAMGLSDMRGIGNEVQVVWNGKAFTFNPGAVDKGLFATGIQASIPIEVGTTPSVQHVDNNNVPLASDKLLSGYEFEINLTLKGSEQIFFTPVGKTTQVNLQSNWSNPSFAGAFLPDKRDITDKGFNASWQVLHTNRNFPQRWVSDTPYDLSTADFGVKLFMPVDGYLKSTRAVKYAILIIGLTFLVFYFIELLQQRAVHPLQYILIGVALCIFYTLLIALAEQLSFNLAYLVSTLLTLGLITLYTASVFKSYRMGIGIGGVLLLLYSFIYVIIQSEDQALLMGSLGLFIILAIVMYFSRKIRWDALGKQDA